MTTTILKVLHINYVQYDNYRFNEYMGWCVDWATKSTIPLYHLVMNNHLYNWFLTQWHNEVEKPFVAELRSYILAEVEDPITYLNLMEIYGKRLGELYPEQLLNQIYKNYESNTNLRANTAQKGLPVTIRSKRSELPTYKKRNKGLKE